MAVAGSIWIDGLILHWLDSSAVDKQITLTDTGANPTGAVVGSMWVEGDYLHIIDASGNERREIGSLIGTPGGAVVGSAWIEGLNLHYIDSSGEERQLAGGCAAPTLDLATATVAATGTCSGGGCVVIEAHNVSWTQTDCDNACHHIAIHRNLNGGGFIEVSDDDGCTEDNGCTAGEGCRQFTYAVCDTTGDSYVYRVRIEDDGTDTSLSSDDTGTLANRPQDACIL